MHAAKSIAFPDPAIGPTPSWASLLDLMHKFNALEIAACVGNLNGLSCQCVNIELTKGKGTPVGDELLTDAKAALTIVVRAAQTAKLPICGRIAQQNISYLTDDADVSLLKGLLLVVVNAIYADLGKTVFLQVRPERAKFIDHEPLFDIGQPPEQPSVHAAFPSASLDAREAGNCLAADCNTAAVFHLMRVVEWGLRALCVDLGHKRLRCQNRKTGKVTYKPLDYADWESTLGQLKADVNKKILKLKRGSKKQALQEFYLPALQDIEGFKDAFRNHVMHTRREYTGSEADAIRDRVQRFMRLLATRVSEV